MATAPTPHTPDTTRLAPSPTGALHLGNARTFLVNWAMARRRGWRIVLRIEDLDTPRVKRGAVEGIVGTLRWLGMEWDGEDGGRGGGRDTARSGVVPKILVQSQDLEPYRAAMRVLAAKGLVYPSALSRGEVEAAASAPQEGSGETRFPAELRPELRAVEFDEADAGGTNWRFAVARGAVEFTDAFAGAQAIDPSETIGDFVVWTKRGQPAYQLAVVVDDHRQGVTQVVRGDDLLDSAARQLLLYRALGYGPEPTYTHLPLVVGPDGRRLAKRHGDSRVEHYRSRGVPAEAVIGLIAWWSGMRESGAAGERARAMSAAEFMERLDLGTMSRVPVVFRAEDDAWLKSCAT